jgi:glutaredoxin
MWSATTFIHCFEINWQEVIQELSLSKAHVIVYSKPGCHLCDEARAAIQNSGLNDCFILEEVNIESDPELLRKYKYEIPVVMIDGVECFRYRVNVEELKRIIKPSID